MNGTPSGIVFRIERFAIHDGPGIRTTVFLKGCPLSCLWCHSPESQSPVPEFMPLADRCIGCGSCVAACPANANHAGPGLQLGAGPGLKPGAYDPTFEGGTFRPTICKMCGRCAEACPTGARVLAGTAMSVDDIVKAVERDRIFYDESGGGVTFSGGEPLMQAVFVEALVDACRERAIHVAVDTSGFGDPAALDRLDPDLFLFDVKAVDEQRHRAITGVSNRVILDNLARVAAKRRSDGPKVRESESRVRPSDLRTFGLSDLIVRFPLVPGVTDDEDNIRAVGRTISSLGIDRIDVLPYHRAGLAKYERLGRPYALGDTEPPGAEQVRRAVDMLSEYGLTVRAGGA